MPTRPLLGLPQRMIWATNTNRTLDPDDTSGFTYPVTKEDGWTVGTRPPAKVMNWIHNLQQQWAAHIGGSAVGNWFPNTALGGTPTVNGLVFVPGAQQYEWVLAAGTGVYISNSGNTWTSAATLTSAAVTGAATLQDDNRAIFGTANGLEHSASLTFSSWTQVLKATIGITNDIYSMDTKATGSSFLMVVTSTNEIAIAATGVLGSWAAPTAPPPTITGPKKLVYAGDSTWFLMAGSSTYVTSDLYVSTDDGDTWASASMPVTRIEYGHSIAYDPGTGRLVIVGQETSASPSGVPRILYTDDNGSSYSNAILEAYHRNTVTTLKDVYACGGGVWVACCIPNNRIFISTDNAENWFPANVHELYDNTASKGLHYLAGDGKQILAAGTDGVTGYCLSPGRTSDVEGTT